MRAHPTPGEWKTHTAPIILVIKQPNRSSRVQCAIQQRRMQTKGPGPLTLSLGQHHLREQLILAAPSRGQPLEDRAIFETQPNQTVVEIVDLDGVGVPRWPSLERECRHPPLDCRFDVGSPR